MKRVYLFTACMLIGLLTFAQTNHSGTISFNEAWFASDNPHVITGNLTIADGVTLLIQPGCEIYFNSNRRMVVRGALSANGTVASPIIFSSNNASPASGDWRFIDFNGADAGSLLNYCNLSYGGASNSMVLIRNSGSNVTVMNSNFSYSGGYGLRVRTASDSPVIMDCSFDNCSNYPLYVYADRVKDLAGSMTFTSNNPDAILVQRQNINTGTWLNYGVPYVINGDCDVVDLQTLTLVPGLQLNFNPNSRLRVYGALVADGDMANPIVFTSNQAVPASGDWERIFFDGADAGTILDYCQVLYSGSGTAGLDLRNCGSNVALSNTIVQYSDAYGVYLRNGSSPSFINCEILNNNDIGIYINGACTPTFGSSELEWNDIYDNGNYELRNGSLDIDAMYVYWGTDGCGSVAAKIYDNEDQANLGVVNYYPYLDAGHGIPALATTWTGTLNTSWHIDDNWTNNAPCGFVDATIPQAPINQPFVFGPENCNNLVVEAGARLTVGSGNSLTVNGDLSLGADASGTASILENGGLSVMGNTSSQFWVSEERWHYVSPPMSGQTANTFFGLYLYGHNEFDNSWYNIVPEPTPINVGEGYKVWSYSSSTGDVSVEFSGGTLNSGDFTFPVTLSGSGWNFVGNPYPSAVDWDNLSWIKTYVDGTVYVWDGTQYLSWNGSVGDLTDGIIPAMQSFFVLANGPNPILQVSNLARTHGVDPYKEEKVNELLKLTITGNEMYDRTFVNFNSEATPDIDSDFDGYKIIGHEDAPQLYSMVNNEKLRVNVLPEISTDLTIPLGLEVSAETEYKIVASELETFGSDVNIYLEDTKEGEMINLTLHPEYTFTASSSDDVNRFNLHFMKATSIPEKETKEMQIYSNESSVYVINNDGALSGASVVLYNIAGQKVFESNVHDEPLNRFDLQLKTGYYVVKVISTDLIVSEKVMIK